MLGRALQEANTNCVAKSSQRPQDIANASNSRSSAASNISISRWTGYKNPLKRTASQAQSKNSQSKLQAPVKIGSRLYGDAFGPLGGIGMVDKLHENVYFDENDFEDDADLDLNNEEPILTPKDIHYPRVPSSINTLYPSLPSPHAASPASIQASSGQSIPWSSSPLHHTAPPMSHLENCQRQNNHQQSEPQETESSRSLTPLNQSKRRTIPWLDEHNADLLNPMVPPHAKKIIERKQGSEARISTQNVSSTPVPKQNRDSPYAWNMTASGVKAEQKKLRQGNKKLVKDNIDEEKRVSTKKAKRVSRVFLSEEQRKVLDLVVEAKRSVFFTGSAGTGKSVLMREIIQSLGQEYLREPDRVAVTASTGLAACNVAGVTLHSFAGIGLGKEALPELVKKIKRNPKAKNRWQRTKVLIIDEISMVDGDLFDKLEGIARIIRNNGRPFGGIQLVITGDFFQLPPVPNYGKVAKFCFDAATWNTSIEHTIGLTQVFRQKDPEFANMLNEMRLGRLTESSINTFHSLHRPLSFKEDFEATELFPTRVEVDNANNARMQNLGGKSWEFRAEDSGSITDLTQRDKLLQNCMAAPLITLKKGAQVMLIKNIDDQLVNGSVGKVLAFMDEKTFDLYHSDEDMFHALVSEDNEELSESRMKIKQMMNKNPVGDTSLIWPLVRFALPDGTTREMLCQHESWKIELPNGEVQASRTQIPLMLAWALSIHKAQGQTLERVKVDLGKTFEKGQAYVALSRATCKEGLQILRFDPKKVMAHDRVRSFYNSLYSIEENALGKIEGRVGPKKYTQESRDSEQIWDDEDALRELDAHTRAPSHVWSGTNFECQGYKDSAPRPTPVLNIPPLHENSVPMAASEFIGMSVAVTLKDPPNAQIRGLVQAVVEGHSLRLKNATWVSTGVLAPLLVVGTANIRELEIVPEATATLLAAKTKQPFADPAILSYDRPSVQKLIGAPPRPSQATADSLATQNSIQETPVPTPCAEDVIASATLTEPFDNPTLNGSPTHETNQDQEDEKIPRGKARQKRRRRPLRNRQHENNNIRDGLLPKANDGWGNPPFLEEPKSNKQTHPLDAPIHRAETRLARARKHNRQHDQTEEHNGWATEEATDIQDMGDFDFEGNLSKFDKKGVFDQIKQEDTTADEARLVSFNRLPSRPGTNGGKNLHYTENVLDSPKQNGRVDWSSSEDEENHPGKVSSERSSRRAISRASARKVPSRKGSAVIGHDHIAGLGSLPRLPSNEHSILSIKAKSSSSRYTSSKAPGSSKPCFQLVSSGVSCACITPLQMLELEQLAISELELSEEILNENAARTIAQMALRLAHGERTFILAGNNKSGARAIGAGRQLRNHGVQVHALVLGSERWDDLIEVVRRQLTLYRNCGGQVTKLERLTKTVKHDRAPKSLIIDALLGMHSSFDDLRTIDRAVCFELVTWANSGGARILSIDVPSGLDASTGLNSTTVSEDLRIHSYSTLSLGAPKTGLLSALSASREPDARAWKCYVGDIGICNSVWKKLGTKWRHGVDFGGDWVVEVKVGSE